MRGTLKWYLIVAGILLIIIVGIYAVFDQITDYQDKDVSQKIELNLWHIWTTDTDANRMTLKLALNEIQKEYPDVQINVTTRETEVYKNWLRTAIATNEQPDIFYTWGAGYSDDFVRTGKVASMQQYYESKLKNVLPQKYLDYQIYDNKLYGLPFMRSYAVLYIHKDIFDKYNLPYPKTYDDFKTITEKLKGTHITPMAASGSDQWPIMFQYASLCIREMGAENVKKALQGKISFQQDGFIRAGYILQEQAEYGLFGDSYLNLTYDEAAREFINGQAAMMYIGSWAMSGFYDLPESCGDIQVMSYPKKGGMYDDDYLGGTADCFMVSNYSKHKELAIEIVAKLSEKMSSIGVQKGMTLPIWSNEKVKFNRYENETDETYHLRCQIVGQTMELAQTSKDSVLWWDTLLGNKGNEVNKLIIQMITKQITPNEYVERMDRLIIEKREEE